MKKFISKSTLVLGLLIFALYGTALAADPFTAMEIIRPKVRMNAPAFNLKDVGGGRKALSAFKGKVILLNFWATWCPNCREEMPSLEKLWKQFKTKGVVVLAVAVNRRSEDVESFAQKLGLTFPILLDTDGTVRKKYEITALPMTYFIGKDGKISGRMFGGRDWTGKNADALVKQLLRNGR